MAKTERNVWKVIISGKDSGIRETNYGYAVKHWKERARRTGKKIVLRKVR